MLCNIPCSVKSKCINLNNSYVNGKLCFDKKKIN